MYFVSIFYSLALTIAGIVIIVIDIIKSYGNPGEQNNWKKFLLIPYILIPWLVTLIKYQSFNPFPFIVETPIIITACTPIIIGFLNKTKIREIMPVT